MGRRIRQNLYLLPIRTKHQNKASLISPVLLPMYPDKPGIWNKRDLRDLICLHLQGAIWINMDLKDQMHLPVLPPDRQGLMEVRV